jgi:hypothetical protein
MYELVKVQPLASHKFKLLEDFTYGDVVVPKYYETNGADVPRLLWSIFPPNRSDYLPAVILHDYLCDLKLYKKADDYFESCLLELGVDKSDIKYLVAGVRLYHKYEYGVK